MLGRDLWGLVMGFPVRRTSLTGSNLTKIRYQPISIPPEHDSINEPLSKISHTPAYVAAFCLSRN